MLQVAAVALLVGLRERAAVQLVEMDQQLQMDLLHLQPIEVVEAAVLVGVRVAEALAAAALSLFVTQILTPQPQPQLALRQRRIPAVIFITLGPEPVLLRSEARHGSFCKT
jgi:hypothetical protein